MDPLAAVEDLRLWAQDPDLDAGLATLLLAAASAQVRDETGQDFTAVSGDTVQLDGVEDQWLALPQRPVTAVTAVAVNGAALATDGWTLAGDRLYRHWGWMGRNWRPWAPTLVSVTYDHGYAVIPDDVKSATLGLASEMLANPQGLTAEDIDDYRWRRDSAATTPAGLLLASVVRRYGPRARSVRLGR